MLITELSSVVTVSCIGGELVKEPDWRKRAREPAHHHDDGE
jgi:hypothetical protein